jgi:predicted TIM-barrel fold metal-dependent hydrolase
MDAQKVIVVSVDSHATPPPEMWADYLDPDYHGLLPGVYEDNRKFLELFGMRSTFSPEVLDIIDAEGAWRSGGYLGVWDPDRRLAEMDREGVAAEVVYSNDMRAIPLFAPLYRRYPQEVIAAGARAYDRWAADVFGKHSDRILLVGDPGAGVEMDSMLAALQWTADHGFVGARLPGSIARHDLPPLYHEFFEPFWSMCEDHAMPIIIHAGYGQEQCEVVTQHNEVLRNMKAAGRHDLQAEIFNTADSFDSFVRARRAMWQLMLGGVFDRHPKLQLVLAEVRADWLPGTLDYLDAAYDRAGAGVPAKRRPSEYWLSNCLTCLSFVHRAEANMRKEIGIPTIMFGRDYPHAEGTWPNTLDWVSDALADVPEGELRQMLGGNAIQLLGLDETRLAQIADRIGPTLEDIMARPRPGPQMVAHWADRGGYLKPREQIDERALQPLVSEDLVGLVTSSGQTC